MCVRPSSRKSIREVPAPSPSPPRWLLHPPSRTFCIRVGARTRFRVGSSAQLARGEHCSRNGDTLFIPIATMRNWSRRISWMLPPPTLWHPASRRFSLFIHARVWWSLRRFGYGAAQAARAIAAEFASKAWRECECDLWARAAGARRIAGGPAETGLQRIYCEYARPSLLAGIAQAYRWRASTRLWRSGVFDGPANARARSPAVARRRRSHRGSGCLLPDVGPNAEQYLSRAMHRNDAASAVAPGAGARCAAADARARVPTAATRRLPSRRLEGRLHKPPMDAYVDQWGDQGEPTRRLSPRHERRRECAVRPTSTAAESDGFSS